MKRSDRIQRVLSMAGSEERRECLEFGKAQRALEKEIGKLEELKSYRRSYAERTLPNVAVSAVRWQDYQQFLQRLDQAVNAQKQVIREGEHNMDVHKRRWMVKRQRLESLERVVERFRKAESVHDERLVQKALDELPHNSDLYDDQH